METLRQIWGVLLNPPDIIRALLPWDVGQSQWLLWGSVALFVVAGLTLSKAFGWMCGWVVGRLIQPRS
jgi:hypothetical protein